MKSTAIMFTRPKQVEIQTYQIAELRPSEILVRTEYSGVSQGTEIWAYLGKRSELPFPIVPGYQSIGIVDHVGADAADYKVGDRVMFTASRLPETLPFTWMGCHLSHA